MSSAHTETRETLLQKTAENKLTATATGQIRLENSPVVPPLQEGRWVWSMPFGAERLLITAL
jgi:hypothetical protein